MTDNSALHRIAVLSDIHGVLSDTHGVSPASTASLRRPRRLSGIHGVLPAPA